MDANSDIKRKRHIWTPEAEEMLYKIWSRIRSELRGSKMNPKIFEKISHELDADGFVYTAKEVKTKIKNAKSKYRDERRLLQTSGVKSSWSHFQTVHNIYGKHKNFHLEPESEGCGDDNSSDHNVSAPSEGIDVDYSSDDFNEDSIVSVPSEGIEFRSEAESDKSGADDNSPDHNVHLIIYEQKQISLELQREMLAIQKERNVILVKMLDVFKNYWKKNTAIEENSAAKRIKLNDNTNDDVQKAEAQNGNGIGFL